MGLSRRVRRLQADEPDPLDIIFQGALGCAMQIERPASERRAKEWDQRSLPCLNAIAVTQRWLPGAYTAEGEAVLATSLAWPDRYRTRQKAALQDQRSSNEDGATLHVAGADQSNPSSQTAILPQESRPPISRSKRSLSHCLIMLW
jgi:hypothetical protein